MEPIQTLSLESFNIEVILFSSLILEEE